MRDLGLGAGLATARGASGRVKPTGEGRAVGLVASAQAAWFCAAGREADAV